jgi:two-component system chemotaxis response regulator CheB
VIRVLVVDDSALVRKLLSEELSACDGIEVVGTAMDPYVARERIVELEPDVITLDVEMPRMNGLAFLDKLMEHHPIPVVVVSSLTPENSDGALRALALGAVDVIPKPGSQFSIPEVGKRLARSVRAAAESRPRKIRRRARDRTEEKPPAELAGLDTTHKVLAIGASTGGTRALEAIVRRLPANTPGTVIVQHMPAGFTAPFAARLDGVSPLKIREATGRHAVVPGLALLAPGGSHMVVDRSGARYVARVKDGPPVHHQKPAVDVLFRSLARSAGRNAVGAVLTGMGSDGAAGLLEMQEAGAHTVVQDEATSVVFGMPKAAIELGAATEVRPLDEIPGALLRALKSESGAGASPDAA